VRYGDRRGVSLEAVARPDALRLPPVSFARRTYRVHDGIGLAGSAPIGSTGLRQRIVKAHGRQIGRPHLARYIASPHADRIAFVP
jgi:hypothetical protein